MPVTQLARARPVSPAITGKESTRDEKRRAMVSPLLTGNPRNDVSYMEIE
jgi:hypothetical protein